MVGRLYRRVQAELNAGYTTNFAMISMALRRRAEVVGPQQMRKYTIDISHHEFCEGKVKREVDDYTIYVYSLEMIAAEKLRAICQQMPEYAVPPH